MDCRIFEEDIALGADADSNPALAEHLSVCTSCAEAAHEFASLQNLFLDASTTEIPDGLVASVKYAVATELRANDRVENDSPSEFGAFVQQWLVPYSVAGAASILITGSLLWLLLIGAGSAPEGVVFAPPENDSNEVVFLDSRTDPTTLNNSRVSAKELAASRSNVSSVSPSINPNGTIVTLASALTSGRIRANEIVILASVRRDGTAELERIVEPIGDRNVALEVRQAMSQRGADSPFVSSVLDNRSDDTTVVFRITRVDVTSPNKEKSR